MFPLTWKQRRGWCRGRPAWQIRPSIRKLLISTPSHPLHCLSTIFFSPSVIFIELKIFKIFTKLKMPKNSNFEKLTFDIWSFELITFPARSWRTPATLNLLIGLLWHCDSQLWIYHHLLGLLSLLLLLLPVLVVLVGHVGDGGVKFLLGGRPQSGGGPCAHHVIDVYNANANSSQQPTRSCHPPSTYSTSSSTSVTTNPTPPLSPAFLSLFNGVAFMLLVGRQIQAEATT